LPGHGSLGSRGQCPRHVWLGPLAHEWYPSSPPIMHSMTVAGTKTSKKVTLDAVVKVQRSGNAKPCPLTCASCAASSASGTAAVCVEPVPPTPAVQSGRCRRC
jgi:hypothetical protein